METGSPIVVTEADAAAALRGFTAVMCRLLYNYRYLVCFAVAFPLSFVIFRAHGSRTSIFVSIVIRAVLVALLLVWTIAAVRRDRRKSNARIFPVGATLSTTAGPDGYSSAGPFGSYTTVWDRLERGWVTSDVLVLKIRSTMQFVISLRRGWSDADLLVVREHVRLREL